MDLLLSYSWPGNVRELENAIEHAVVMAAHDTTLLKPDLLPLSVSTGKKKSTAASRGRPRQATQPLVEV
jgi:transcriptional regulator with PAS, ATPase and Fis domain